MKITRAKTMVDVLKWISNNDHFQGWRDDQVNRSKDFHLAGDHAELIIPASVHVPRMMEPCEFRKTNRMYRPSAQGLKLLEKHNEVRA